MPLELPTERPLLTTMTGKYSLSILKDKTYYEDIAAILATDNIWAQGFGNNAQRPITHDECLAFIDNFICVDERIIWAIIENESGKAIGTTGLATINAELERCQVGRTIISPDWWGKKVNHEIKLVLVDWLFENGAGRVECEVESLNYRSANSLTSFGFTSEGIRRRSSQRWDGTWRDIQVFSIVREEWEDIRIARANELLETD